MKKINGRVIRICTALMIIFFLVSLSVAVSGNNNDTSNVTSDVTPNTYQVYVDNDYGFYRVVDRTTRKPLNYTNKTLNISVGDTITWMNDATPDEALTIISEQDLWENRSAYLRWNYQKFSYTFNQSGTYTFFVKEYKRLQHQTIIVRDVDSGLAPVPTVIMKPVSKPTTTYTSVPTVNNTINTTIGKTNKMSAPGIVTVIIVILSIYFYRNGG